MPVIVPPVPMPATKWVMRALGLLPDLGAGAVLVRRAGCSGFAYWSGFHAPGISRTRRSDVE